MDEKIIALETRLAFQEKMIDDLNSVVIRQQDQLDELVEKVEVLAKEFKQIVRELPQDKDKEEAPPHY